MSGLSNGCLTSPLQPLQRASFCVILHAFHADRKHQCSLRRAGHHGPDVPVAEALEDWAGYHDGTLPCVACHGIETTLQIYSDGSYVLQEKYLDRDTWRNGHVGKWKAVQGGVELAHARDGGPMRWVAVGDDLRLADNDGGPMPGDLPYTIEKLAGEIYDEVPRMYMLGHPPHRRGEPQLRALRIRAQLPACGG